jgi:hypothetical protein
LAENRTRRISDAKTAAKAQWEADKCSKHHGYRLKDIAGSKRPIPMNSAKPLAARFYRLKSGHALWRENPFLTTTATQLDRGLSYGGCTEIQG